MQHRINACKALISCRKYFTTFWKHANKIFQLWPLKNFTSEPRTCSRASVQFTFLCLYSKMTYRGLSWPLQKALAMCRLSFSLYSDLHIINEKKRMLSHSRRIICIYSQICFPPSCSSFFFHVDSIGNTI